MGKWICALQFQSISEIYFSGKCKIWGGSSNLWSTSAPIDKHAKRDDGSASQSRRDPTHAGAVAFPLWVPRCAVHLIPDSLPIPWFSKCIWWRQDHRNQMPLPGQNPEAAIGVFPDHVLQQRTSKFSGDSMLSWSEIQHGTQDKGRQHKTMLPDVKMVGWHCHMLSKFDGFSSAVAKGYGLICRGSL